MKKLLKYFFTFFLSKDSFFVFYKFLRILLMNLCLNKFYYYDLE